MSSTSLLEPDLGTTSAGGKQCAAGAVYHDETHVILGNETIKE